MDATTKMVDVTKGANKTCSASKEMSAEVTILISEDAHLRNEFETILRETMAVKIIPNQIQISVVAGSQSLTRYFFATTLLHRIILILRQAP